MARAGSVSVGDFYLLSKRGALARYETGTTSVVEVVHAGGAYTVDQTDIEGRPDPRNGSRVQHVKVHTYRGLSVNTSAASLVRRASEAQIASFRRDRFLHFMRRSVHNVAAALERDGAAVSEATRTHFAIKLAKLFSEVSP